MKASSKRAKGKGGSRRIALHAFVPSTSMSPLINAYYIIIRSRDYTYDHVYAPQQTGTAEATCQVSALISHPSAGTTSLASCAPCRP